MIHIHVYTRELLSKVRNIVRQTEKVLAIVFLAHLTRDLKLVSLVLNRTSAFSGHHRGAGDSVVEDDSSIHFKQLSGSREVLRRNLRVAAALYTKQ